MFFDEKKETFASAYNVLNREIQELFREKWEDIKAGRIVPIKQKGQGTYHRMEELDAIREKLPFSWDMKIADFKREYKKL